MKKIFLIFAVLMPLSAQAEPFTYAAEQCDFKIVFPEKPFIEQKCATKNSCHDVVSFTQTDAASSLNFRVTCIPEDKDKIKDLSPDNVKETLRGLVNDAGLQIFGQDAATLDDGIRTSVAIAGGKRNETDVIYTGQIWLGPASILTLEGEMVGPANKNIEKTYTEILKSVAPKLTANKKAVTPAVKKP